MLRVLTLMSLVIVATLLSIEEAVALFESKEEEKRKEKSWKNEEKNQAEDARLAASDG